MNGARHRVALAFTVIFLICLTGFYPFLLYTDNDFVSRYRSLYIETAMSTMTHQWLATYFIPHEIIDEVMTKRYLMQENQSGAQSEWESIINAKNEDENQQKIMTQKERFLMTYSELDENSFNDFIKLHPDAIGDGYANLEFDLIDTGYSGLFTKQGDEVLAINAKYGIMIVEITGIDDMTGMDYRGKLAFVKNPKQVIVGTCAAYGESGSFVNEMVTDYDAILGINASGFEDPDGKGSGGVPYGFVKSRGRLYQDAVGGEWKIIGFDQDNLLQIGAFSDTSNIRDAVEFQPALIINGKVLVDDSGGIGVQPQTAIGQKVDNTVLMLVIDGRQDHSIGCIMGECAEILNRYGAYQAARLDGGSSSVMVYDGREITKPTTASGNSEGRTLPNAFLVLRDE